MYMFLRIVFFNVFRVMYIYGNILIVVNIFGENIYINYWLLFLIDVYLYIYLCLCMYWVGYNECIFNCLKIVIKLLLVMYIYM